MNTQSRINTRGACQNQVKSLESVKTRSNQFQLTKIALFTTLTVLSAGGYSAVTTPIVVTPGASDNAIVVNVDDLLISGTDHGITANGIHSSIINDGVINIVGSGQGINVTAQTGGEISVINNGSISTSAANAHGINAGGAAGKIDVKNHGTITTTGNNAFGISAISNTDMVTVTNTGNININSGRHAIKAESNGVIGDYGVRVNNSGDIFHDGLLQGWTIHVLAHTGKAELVNTGNITAHHSQAINVASRGDDATVIASGNITATVNGGSGVNTAIEVSTTADNATASIHYSNGIVRIDGNGDAFCAWDATSGGNWHNVTAQVIIGENALIDASRAMSWGVDIETGYKGQFYLAKGSKLSGGAGGGIAFRSKSGTLSPEFLLTNYGEIDAASDHVVSNGVYGGAGATGTLTIDNYGQMSGYVTFTNEDTTFTNYSSGEWQLRHFSDADLDGERDTKEIAIADFGGGNDRFINESGGVLRLAAVNGNTNLASTANEYRPSGALSITNDGTVHGQLVNLNQFDNKGTIDLTANAQAGDVLVITGAGSVGAGFGGGNGSYISNGGFVKLDTVLNRGDADSLSDILVVDNVSLGAGGATKVNINTVGGDGALTEGDGIKIIEVKGTQADGGFTLGAPVTYGQYEYVMGQGTGAEAANWFLRNNLNGQSLINPVSGAFLGNQHAAANMFTQSIVDRRDAVYAPDSNVWMRINHSDLDMDVTGGSQSVNIKSTMMQLGADIARYDETRIGVYAGYGQSDVENQSKLTGSKVEGEVKGYQIGAYGSWIPTQNEGWYADIWTQYAWFDNTLKGSDVDYDSSVWTTSAEVGYGIPFAKSDSFSWIVQPHAQLSYSFSDTDDFTDGSNTRFSDAQGDGFKTRLGARLYGLSADGIGISPFAEVNWLHNDVDNSVKLNGQRISADGSKDLAELKVGFEGHVNKNLSAWAHVGGQWGDKDYSRYEGQIGIGYKW